MLRFMVQLHVHSSSHSQCERRESTSCDAPLGILWWCLCDLFAKRRYEAKNQLLSSRARQMLDDKEC